MRSVSVRDHLHRRSLVVLTNVVHDAFGRIMLAEVRRCRFSSNTAAVTIEAPVQLMIRGAQVWCRNDGHMAFVAVTPEACQGFDSSTVHWRGLQDSLAVEKKPSRRGFPT